MDRQPNDRLGRIQRQRFEHWGQILRARWFVTNAYTYCHSHAYTNTHCYSYPNTYSYCHPLGYSYSHLHSHCNPYIYPHSNGHIYTYSDAYAHAHANPMHWEMFTDAEAVSDFGWATDSAASPHTTADAYGFASPNPGTATVGLIGSNQ
jgi:hypothetical protein